MGINSAGKGAFVDLYNNKFINRIFNLCFIN